MTTLSASPARFESRSVRPLLAISGTLFIVVPLLVEMVDDDLLALFPLALLTLVAAMPGIRRAQAGDDGETGRWGMRLTGIGLVGAVTVFVVGGFLGVETGSAAEVALMAVALSLTAAALVGIGLFCLGMLRARRFSVSAVRVFAGGLVFALAAEVIEQSLPGRVPLLADLAPPLGFVTCGIGLLLVAVAARK